jgi:hypothetical protein
VAAKLYLDIKRREGHFETLECGLNGLSHRRETLHKKGWDHGNTDEELPYLLKLNTYLNDH